MPFGLTVFGVVSNHKNFNSGLRDWLELCNWSGQLLESHYHYSNHSSRIALPNGA